MKWVKGNGYLFRRDNSVRVSFASLFKGVYSKRKEFFPFRVDPFSEGTWCALKESKQDVTEVYPLVVKIVKKSTKCIKSPKRNK